MSKILPHPPLFLSEIRPLDMILLLAAGAAWETLARTILLLGYKRKSSSLQKKEQRWEALLFETNQKRKLGQVAFVETSKLERSLLALEKELDQTRTARNKARTQMERYFLRYGNILMSFIIFILYYGIPIVTLESSLEPELGQSLYASPPLKSMLFPVSYVGIGMRVARWGLQDPTNSVGALVVFWSAQVLCGQAFDGMDALLV